MNAQAGETFPERDQRAQSGIPAPSAPPVKYPIMIHHWRHFTFLHWRYQPDLIQSLLPPGLRVETFNGTAWVGVLPFRMEGVRVPRLTALPWLSTFPETNVRTYVRGPDGRTGIWFLSLDAARLPVVAAARVGYGLPYYWSDMSVDGTDTMQVYRSRRRWPGPDGARCDATVRIGPPLAATEPGPLDHFLTARYRLYSSLAGQLIAANAEHAPWPLHQAQVTHLNQNLLQAAHLPAPDHEPVAHASPGVTVRIGIWRPV
jgi:uncharacterized protein